MAKTLANTAGCEEIRRRIAALTPESRRVWGSMSIGGMLCHVDDSYRAVMGEKPFSMAKLGIPPWLAKFVALRAPMQWPRNLTTSESVRQGGGGTPPVEFAEDRERLLETFAHFCGCAELATAHPMFGNMSADDWLRWGWLHADHHLRQFSA
jgi:Protein of unknown function (DUF1569)